MKLSSMIALGALVSAAMAGPALAGSLSPNGAFQADGSTSLTIGTTTLACTAHMVGTVSGGVGTISTATFSGGPLGSCALAAKTGTWTVTALSATSIQISGLAVNTPIGNCTAGTVTGAYNNTTHQLTFANQTLPPNCKVSAALTTHDAALTAS
jgi:hypothetical protein